MVSPIWLPGCLRPEWRVARTKGAEQRDRGEVADENSDHDSQRDNTCRRDDSAGDAAQPEDEAARWRCPSKRENGQDHRHRKRQKAHAEGESASSVDAD